MHLEEDVSVTRKVHFIVMLYTPFPIYLTHFPLLLRHFRFLCIKVPFSHTLYVAFMSHSNFPSPSIPFTGVVNTVPRGDPL